MNVSDDQIRLVTDLLSYSNAALQLLYKSINVLMIMMQLSALVVFGYGFFADSTLLVLMSILMVVSVAFLDSYVTGFMSEAGEQINAAVDAWK